METAINTTHLLYLLRSIGIKLNLPIGVILDASLFLRRYLGSGSNIETHQRGTVILLTACLYLSSKINEEEGRVRVRDFLNVAFYAYKEDAEVRQHDGTDNGFPARNEYDEC